VGRPNVGKSRFSTGLRTASFHRWRRAWHHRDRIYGEYEWRGAVSAGGYGRHGADDAELIPARFLPGPGGAQRGRCAGAGGGRAHGTASPTTTGEDADSRRQARLSSRQQVEGDAMDAAARTFASWASATFFPSAQNTAWASDLLEAISEVIPEPPEAVKTEEEALALKRKRHGSRRG